MLPLLYYKCRKKNKIPKGFNNCRLKKKDKRKKIKKEKRKRGKKDKRING